MILKKETIVTIVRPSTGRIKKSIKAKPIEWTPKKFLGQNATANLNVRIAKLEEKKENLFLLASIRKSATLNFFHTFVLMPYNVAVHRPPEKIVTVDSPQQQQPPTPSSPSHGAYRKLVIETAGCPRTFKLIIRNVVSARGPSHESKTRLSTGPKRHDAAPGISQIAVFPHENF